MSLAVAFNHTVAGPLRAAVNAQDSQNPYAIASTVLSSGS